MRADAGPQIQEVIVQNFRAWPGTRMAEAPEPPLEDHLWTIAAARIVLGPDRHLTLSVFALYWHFVDAVWIFVFSSLYLSPHLR